MKLKLVEGIWDKRLLGVFRDLKPMVTLSIFSPKPVINNEKIKTQTQTRTEIFLILQYLDSAWQPTLVFMCEESPWQEEPG